MIGELIDRSSLGGGVFDLGSATFNLTPILTGQLDSYALLGSSPEFHISCVAAASSELHAKLLDAVQRGMERLLALDIVPPPHPD